MTKNPNDLTKQITDHHRLYEACDMIYTNKLDHTIVNLGDKGTFFMIRALETGNENNRLVHKDTTSQLIDDAIDAENFSREEYYRERNQDHSMDNMPVGDPTMEGELT
tara:strand:+ start:282 stop:605 length:324 start_codon:yes stop_codon:yes gene_type:complete